MLIRRMSTYSGGESDYTSHHYILSRCRFTFFPLARSYHAICICSHIYIKSARARGEYLDACLVSGRWNFLRAQCFKSVSLEREIETLLIRSAAALLLLLKRVPPSSIDDKTTTATCSHACMSLSLFPSLLHSMPFVNSPTHICMRARSTDQLSIAVKHGIFSRSLEMHGYIHTHLSDGEET